jgi:hypothetical protein
MPGSAAADFIASASPEVGGVVPAGAVPVGAEVARDRLGAEVVGVGAVRLSRLAWVWVLLAQLFGMLTPLGAAPVGVGTAVEAIVGTMVGAAAGAAGARAGVRSGLVGVDGWFR